VRIFMFTYFVSKLFNGFRIESALLVVGMSVTSELYVRPI
jgi:hypothetical protein